MQNKKKFFIPENQKLRQRWIEWTNLCCPTIWFAMFVFFKWVLFSYTQHQNLNIVKKNMCIMYDDRSSYYWLCSIIILFSFDLSFNLFLGWILIQTTSYSFFMGADLRKNFFFFEMKKNSFDFRKDMSELVVVMVVVLVDKLTNFLSILLYQWKHWF